MLSSDAISMATEIPTEEKEAGACWRQGPLKPAGSCSPAPLRALGTARPLQRPRQTRPAPRET